MKKIFFYLSIFLISACSVLESGRIAPGYTEAFSSVKNALIGYEDTFITPKLIQEIPYASAMVKIGKGPFGLMILESIDNNRTTWVSADNVYLVIEKGKIVKTSGLLNNITDLQAPYFFSSSNLLQADNSIVYKFYYSFDPPHLVNLEVNTSYEIKGKRIVKLFNEEKELTLIHETINNSDIGWKALNKYWIDDDDFVWKSEQRLSPKLPKLFFEVTKKPSR